MDVIIQSLTNITIIAWYISINSVVYSIIRKYLKINEHRLMVD